LAAAESAGAFKGSLGLGASVDLDGFDREGHGMKQALQKTRCGGGGCLAVDFEVIPT
jgi:hypothetical protein